MWYGGIFTYDIPTGTITNISNDVNQRSPAISTALIVWEDVRFGGEHIGVFDRSTHATRIIGDPSSSQSQPRVSGTNIVFSSVDANYKHSIIVLDNQTATMSTLATGSLGNADMDGTHVVWLADNGVGVDVVVHDLSTGAEKRLTTSASGFFGQPRISGEFVAFQN